MKIIEISERPLQPSWCASTILEVTSLPIKFRFEVSGHTNKRMRRSLVLLIYRYLSAILGVFPHGNIRHSDSRDYNFFRQAERGIRLHQAPETKNESGRLGFRIRMLRLHLGLTQKQLAVRCGITRPYLSKIEKGHHLPGSSTLFALSRELGVDPQTDEIAMHLFAHLLNKGGPLKKKVARHENKTAEIQKPFAACESCEKFNSDLN